MIRPTSSLPQHVNAPFSFDTLKASHCLGVIAGVAFPIITGTLYLSGLLGAYSSLASRAIILMNYSLAALASYLTVKQVGMIKLRYDMIYPNGNTWDFSKRDWSEFDGIRFFNWCVNNGINPLEIQG
ncbi:MAG: hypothetical protein WAM28_05360 [Chlamydiales bacterium]